MQPTKLMSFILIFTLLVVTTLGNVPALASFIDIEQNWAKEAILSLEERGLFEGILADEFLPQASFSHEMAFQLVQGAFQLTSEEEQELRTWLSGLLVAHAEGITRGEFAALVANAMGLGQNGEAPKDLYSSFSDVSQDYPGFLGIEVLQRMALLPNHMVSRFEPYRLMIRSEAAFILDQVLRLESVEGEISEIQADGTIIIPEQSPIRLLGETLYVQDGIHKEAQIQKGDQVRMLTRNGQALLVTVEHQSTSQAFLQGLNKVASTLADVLTPAQVNALVTGDWEQLGEEVRYQLYEELVDRGIAPWEADALIKQDWDNLQVMAQDRLTQEAADYLQVTPELIHAAVNQDWSKLLEYAQVEVAQRLLTSEWLKGTTKN